MTSEQKPDKRLGVLKAAIALFSRTHDVKKVSLEAIAREAGVSPATVYNYFGTRENLVAEVARELFREMLDKIRALNDSDLPFPQKVSQMFSAKMDFIGINRELLPRLLGQNKAILDALDLSAIRDMTRRFFDSGKKQGYIDPAFDTQTLAEYFDILRRGITAKPELVARLEPDSIFVSDLTRLIFYGLMKKAVGPFNHSLFKQNNAVF